MAAGKCLDFLSPSGDKLHLYTLSDKDGIEVDVLSFGATLTSLRVPKLVASRTMPWLVSYRPAVHCEHVPVVRM